MPKKVIVFGASGMLGSMVIDVLSRDPKLKVTATVRKEKLTEKMSRQINGVNWQFFDADASNLLSALGVINGHEWVINTIGITKPLIHEDNAFEVERAIRINSLLPHLIDQQTEKIGAQVIQIATDCVFSGKQGNYVEDDAHDAIDVYGKTKSLGEVRADHVHHLRCSIVGPEPKEHKFLLDWFLGQPQYARVNGYKNHRWNGITTLHFAKLCHGVMTENLTLPHVQHVVPRGEVTKYELLQSFAREFKRNDVSVTPSDANVVIDRILRTSNEVLNQKLWAAADYSQPPSVAEMVAELAGYDYKFIKP